MKLQAKVFLYFLHFLLWVFGFDDVSLSLGLWSDDVLLDVSRKSSLEDSSSMELEFTTLNLLQQNRVPYARDVSLLNSFENVLTNEIV